MGRPPPPRLYIDSDPPAFIGLTKTENLQNPSKDACANVEQPLTDTFFNMSKKHLDPSPLAQQRLLCSKAFNNISHKL